MVQKYVNNLVWLCTVQPHHNVQPLSDRKLNQYLSNMISTKSTIIIFMKLIVQLDVPVKT